MSPPFPSSAAPTAPLNLGDAAAWDRSSSVEALATRQWHPVPPALVAGWPETAPHERREGIEVLRIYFNLLLAHENMIFALTRDYRFNPLVAAFARLQAVLGEQFQSQGARLAKLARCIRSFGGRAPEGWSVFSLAQSGRESSVPTKAAIVAELAGLHEEMVEKLCAGSVLWRQAGCDDAMIQVIGDLAREHESDARALRGLQPAEPIAAST